MRIAVMQPYFYPYAGYFRLFAATDLFVVLDNVQFPRRGWVHRNRLPDRTGKSAWLTLPLVKTPRDATIAVQRFRDDAATALREQSRRFPALVDNEDDELVELLNATEGALVDYLVAQLSAVCTRLDITTPMVRASTIEIDPELRAADRLIAITRALGADVYVNSPGGRALYDRATFASQGVELCFLTDHDGPVHSMLHRVLTEPSGSLRAEIVTQCRLE